MRLPPDRVRGSNLFNLSRSQFPLRRASVVQNLEVSSHAKSRNREFQNFHLVKSVELCQFGPWGQELRAVCRERANRPILFLWSFGWDFHRLKIYFWTSDSCRRVKRWVISTLGRISLQSTLNMFMFWSQTLCSLKHKRMRTCAIPILIPFNGSLFQIAKDQYELYVYKSFFNLKKWNSLADFSVNMSKK